MDDMTTFRELAERCFAIKPELRLLHYGKPLYTSVRPDGSCLWFGYAEVHGTRWYACGFDAVAFDDRAAWVILCDVRQIIFESKGTRCNYAELIQHIAWVPIYESPHCAIARCWLAANGVPSP